MMENYKKISVVIILLISLTCCICSGHNSGHNTVNEAESTSDSNTDTGTGAGTDTGYTLPFDGSFFVRQGSGQCGPTSFYMIFKFHGDSAYAGRFTELPDCAQDLMLQENLSEITENSAVSRWLGVTNSGITIGNLYNKISNLAGDGCARYYDTEGNLDKIESEADKNIQFTRIKSLFLNNQLPVIIHLRRPDVLGMQIYSGHYIVLAGFDSENNLVYIVDPNKKDDAPVGQSVSLSDFLNTSWYVSPDSSTIPDAFWDGTWIGFKHSD